MGEKIHQLFAIIAVAPHNSDIRIGKMLGDVDGFTPDQRFMVGMAQWACENERPCDETVDRRDREMDAAATRPTVAAIRWRT